MLTSNHLDPLLHAYCEERRSAQAKETRRTPGKCTGATSVKLLFRSASRLFVAVGVPYVVLGVTASLVCYLYANFYDIERQLDEVEEEVEEQAREAEEAATPVPPKSST